MSLLFARVELRGAPGDDVYQKLHEHMATINWYKEITGDVTVPLPHATYRATFTADTPNIMQIASGIKSTIEPKIWNKALVLVIRSADWAQTAG
jgi:hypothetical protein